MKRRGFHVSYKTKRRLVIGISALLVLLLYTLKNFSFLIRAASAIGLLISFYLVDHLFELRFHRRHYFFVVVMAITGFILSPFYFLYPSYDKIQHLIMPAMFGSLIYHMVSRLRLERKWRVVFTFFVVLGTIGVFELGEYYLDVLFDLHLQGVFLRDVSGIEKLQILQDRIDDTMTDMSLGVVSALAYCTFAYIKDRVKMRKKN